MDQAYLLVKRIVSKTNDFKFKIMQALFMIQRKRHEAIELLNVINDHVAPSQLDEKVIVNQLLSFAYELTGD